MSIRFVYTPRFVGVALAATAEALSLTRLAATVRKHYSVSATRDSLDIQGRTAVVGAVGAGSLYENVYSSYTTRVVDPATASDVAGGTARTVSVNGVSGSYQCYKTLQYGINDFLTAGGRRLIVKAATYTFTTDLEFPAATGKTDGNRVVLMGDPAELTLPAIDFSNLDIQMLMNWNGDADYVTIRKLEVRNADQVSGLVNFTGADSFKGAIVEYCYLHGVNRSDNDNGALIQLFNEEFGGTYNTDVIIRHCIFEDVPGNGSSHPNAACIQSFHSPGVTIYRNSFTGAAAGIFQKGQPYTMDAAGGWTIRDNVFFGLRANAVLLSIQGAGQAGHYEGTRIYNNLIYDGFGIYCAVSDMAEQSTDIQIYQNTFAEDCVGGVAFNAITNFQFHSNACACTTERVVTEGPSNGFDNSILLCDYNAHYTVQGNTWATNRYSSQVTYSSLAAWRAAYPSNPELLADADENSITFTTLASVFSNAASRDYTAIGALVGAGKDGVDIGCDFANVGPGWTP
jgi:hypothetical protein